MKKLLLLLIVLLPTLCSAGYFVELDCSNQWNDCTKWRCYKLTWFAPDGIHTWEKVYQLRISDIGMCHFCVDGKDFMLPASNVSAERIR
jgi:hypothetical protein